MPEKTELSLVNIVLAISQAVDRVSPHLANHHYRVAYIVSRLAEALGLSEAEQRTLTLAGAMHDIGVLSLAESRALVRFEIEARPDHGEVGYLFLKPFAPLAEAGELIRDHHVYWQDGAGESFCGHAVSPGSHLIHLADRIAVLIPAKGDALVRVTPIREQIAEQKGRMFIPDFVEAFLDLAEDETFWFGAASPGMERLPLRGEAWDLVALDEPGFVELARLFCRIVDFKSAFTAAHSSGVAASAAALGGLIALPDPECTRLTTAGYLHDIGKLSVPLEILEKPAALDEREIGVIRHHSRETFKVLNLIGVDDELRNWSAYHHERLDGSGYPFHLSALQLSRGCRILAIADIFTALVEDRPYRPGMPRHQVLSILLGMTARGWLDRGLVQILSDNFDDVNLLCRQAEESALQDYRSFALARRDYVVQLMAA